MNAADLLALAPFIALAAAPVAVMLGIAVRRSHDLALWLTLGGLAAALVCLPVAAAADDPQVTPLLRVDAFALFAIAVLAGATVVVALLAQSYLRVRSQPPEEFYVLLLTATLGACAMAASTHFASFFLGLELLSVSLYALIAYPGDRAEVLEAAVKYLVLAGATSAFLVFGMALVYTATGEMTVQGLTAALTKDGAAEDLLLALGLVGILVGAGFKLAIVPFHMWTPDIYQGAPAPVGAYIATVSKAGVFFLLLRYFRQVPFDHGSALFAVLTGIAIASMIAGNVLALLQDNVKRILAYSSIAHLGYILVAFLAGGDRGVVAATFYLVIYVTMSLAAFGVVTALSPPDRDAEPIDDYRGLGRTRPAMAGVMAVSLFSLAGIPLTAGFLGKVYLVAAGADAALWALVIVLVLASTVGLYYYTRVIVAMYVQAPPVVEVGTEGRATPGGEVLVSAGRAAAHPGVVITLVLAVLTALVLFAGVYPAPLLRLIEDATAALA